MQSTNYLRHIMLRLFIAGVLVVGLLGLGEELFSDAREGEAAATTAASRDTSDSLITAPDFSRQTIEGESFHLSDHRGKIVVLNFWATWCGPCREEIPDFVELQKELSENVLFVGVALDREGREVVRPFAREYDINYPIIIDSTGALAHEYGRITSVPTTFVINREGKLRYRTPGRIPKDILRSALIELIEIKN